MTGIERVGRRAERVWLGLILAVAAALYLAAALPQLDRVHGGDEINFIETALRLGSGVVQPFGLRHGTGLPLLLAGEFGLWYAVQAALGHMRQPIDVAWAYLHDPTVFVLWGRLTALVAGLGVIVMTWWLGRRLRSPLVGLIAAAWTGWSVLPLTMVMRFKEELPALLGVLAALGCAARLGRLIKGDRRPLRLALWAGICVGAASAFKYTAVLALAPVLLATWWSAPAGAGRLRLVAQRALTVIGASAAAFLVLMPSLLLDRQLWLSGMQDLTSGFTEYRQPVPPTVTRLGWHLPGVVGAPVALLAAAGSVVLLWRHRRVGMWLLAFPAALLAFMSPYLGSPTHLALMIPMVGLTAAVGLAECAARCLWSPTGKPVVPLVPRSVCPPRHAGAGRGGDIPPPAKARARLAGSPRLPGRLIVAALAVLCVWPILADDARLIALAHRPDTRLLARAWVQAHVPAGAHLVVEGARYSDMWLGPRLPQRAEGLTQDVARVKAQGGLGRLAQMRLELAHVHPPAVAFDVTQVFTAEPEALERLRPAYVVTSGYFDLDLFDHESPRRIEIPPCHKPGFLQARLALRQYLARQYVEVTRFDPGVRFHEEFPLTYTCDVARLRRVPVLRGWSQRYQGPVITIYQRRGGHADSATSASVS